MYLQKSIHKMLCILKETKTRWFSFMLLMCDEMGFVGIVDFVVLFEYTFSDVATEGHEGNSRSFLKHV